MDTLRLVAAIDELIVALLSEDLPREGTWRYKVLMAVADRGAYGATDDELAAILQPPGGLNNVRPRRGELVDAGSLIDAGHRRTTSSGNYAGVWILSPGLRQVLWPRFTAKDCDHAAEIEGSHYRDLSGIQSKWSDSLRARIALLGRQAVRAAADAGLPAEASVVDDELVLEVEPAIGVSGRAGVIVRLDGDGIQVVFRVHRAESEDMDEEEEERRRRLRERLGAVPADSRVALASLGDGWEYVVVGDGEEAMEDIDSWLAVIAADAGLQGDVRLRLDPASVEAAGDGIADAVRSVVPAAFRLLSSATSAADDPVARLVDVMHWDEGQAQALVDLAGRSKELLFAGPPGTGKTLAARTLAGAFAGDRRQVRLVQFHPTYAYEDFVEGIRPVLDDDAAGEGLRYELRRGIFREVVDAAVLEPDASFFLVVDEINRANLPRVLGELLFALEYRGEDNVVELPYSGDRIYVPENLWVIGTMNTADRSVALMDAAMRRRFREFRFDVDLAALRRWHTQRTSPELGDEAAVRLERLNAEVVALLDDDRAIGHSLLMREDLAGVGFRTVWSEDLEPVLRDHLLGRIDDLPSLEDAFLGEL